MKPTCTRNLLTLAAAGILTLMAVLTARADYPSAVLADGPLTYHRFSETGVTSDTLPAAVNIGTLGAAANGTHATTFRMSLAVPGVAGALADPDNAALQFPYSPNTHRDNIDVPWQAGLTANGGTNVPFSVECWAKPATRYYSFPLNMMKYDTTPYKGWQFRQTDWDGAVTGNGWGFQLYNGKDTAAVTLIVTQPIDTSHWYHLVGVFDGTSAMLYVDGALMVATNLSAAGKQYVAASSGYPMKMGCRSDNVYQWGGCLDEVAYYTNVLTSAEIAAHYACATTNGAYYPTLVQLKSPAGYWRLNEKFNPSVAQNSGSRGAAAKGQYRTYSTTVPELQGPAYPGFETTNTALQVFGTNGFVVVPPLNFYGNNVTFECMLKRSGTQSDYAGVAMHGNVLANSGSPCVAGLIFRGTGNTLGYWWYSTNTSASDSFNYQSSLVPPDETWVYAAVAITPTSGTIYMYDGTNWSSEVNAKTHKTTSFTGQCWIGGDRNVAARWFKGCVDEVAIYDKALTESQLRSHAFAAFGDTNMPVLAKADPTLYPDTIYAGMPLTLTIDVYGTPPLTYQWRQGPSPDPSTQTNIDGATSAVYAKASASDADTGYYDVIISNASGSVTSSLAYVYVNADSAPTISQDPVSRAVYAGGSATFSVTADGQALTYQWQHADTNLPGATASSLTVANVDATKTGEYRVGVTNGAGGLLSGAATLSLIAFDTNYTYVSTVLADAPEAYWRLDETAAPTIYDSMGRHDGQTWKAAGPAYDDSGSVWTLAWSQTGALADDANKALIFNGNNFARIPFSLDLNVPTYTVELWVKPTNIVGGATHYPLVSEDFYSGPTQVTPPCLPDNYRGGYRFALAGTAKTWTFGVGGITTWDVQAVAPLQAVNTWVHLVGTFDGYQESLYTNGVLVASTIGLGMPNQRLALYIGGDNAAWGFGNPYYGLVDEAAYYKTVLSPARIKLHYQLGKYGTNSLPVFITPPASQTVEFGNPASFNPTLVGASPRTYQWKQGGGDVTGGTDLNLTFASVDYTNAGQYTLAVTNGSGWVVSSAATLTVTPPASVTNLNVRISYPPTGLKLELIWPLGYTLYYTTDLATGPWLPVSGATAPYYNVPINTAIEKIFFKCQ
jgi:hypothetical protein